MAEATNPGFPEVGGSLESPPYCFHYYVYYRIDPARSEHAAMVVRSFQDDVFRRTRVRGRCLHRRDEPLLWMEVYEQVPATVDLSRVLADPPAEVLALLAPGATRTTECFVSAPC